MRACLHDDSSEALWSLLSIMTCQMRSILAYPSAPGALALQPPRARASRLANERDGQYGLGKRLEAVRHRSRCDSSMHARAFS